VPASQVEQAQPFEAPVPHRDAAQESAPIDPARAPVEDPTLTYREQAVPVVFAREILGIGHAGSASWSKLVLVRAGTRLIGLVVGGIGGGEELVIKPLGELLAGHPLVSGTSHSIDGEVILVLDSSGLERWLKIRKASGTSPAASCPLAGPGEGTS